MTSLATLLGRTFSPPPRRDTTAAVAARKARTLAATLGVTIDASDSQPGDTALWIVGGPNDAYPERYATSWVECLQALEAAEARMTGAVEPGAPARWVMRDPNHKGMTMTTHTPTPEEAQAAARLLTAAPDLLAALEAMVRKHEYKNEAFWSDEGRVAHAAIAKARG